MQSIHELVQKAENNYVRGSTKISKYVDFSMHEVIETIYAYLNSKHVSGSQDSKGREKPFFNIVTAAVNIWYRATDIDRKNIRVKATKKRDFLTAFLATIHLHLWMKKARFGQFLNSWGRTLAQYGSAVVKFVERDGELFATVVPWSRLILDSVDFGANVRIEKLFFTPAQLRMEETYDPVVVENLIAGATQSRENLSGEKQDTKSDFIEVYEVHGEMPLSFLTDNEKDERTSRQQVQIISFIEQKDGDLDKFTLYRGKESKDPYMLTHLIEEEGRTLSIGAVEYLFDAQWMRNHTIKNMKDQLDLVSKVVFQTSDVNYASRNVLTEIEQGDILVHAQNAPLTRLNQQSQDIASLQAFGQEWKVLEQEITNTPDLSRGNNLPSGTTLGEVQILNNQTGSLFEVMTENKGLHLEDMLRIHIIPFIKKKMNSSKEISATLEQQDIKQIDSAYIPKEAIAQESNRVINQLLAGVGSVPSPVNLQETEAKIQESLGKLGNMRFFKPDEFKDDVKWSEILKDLEWELDIEITNENTDKQVVLNTLLQVMQTVGQNPQVLQNPNMKTLFTRILEETGRISPIELSSNVEQPAPQVSPPGAQQGAQVGGSAGELPVAQ